jgi:glyoxylase-like metal-dependent hydrolase (beta-lactamase superfamily II)
MTPNITAYEYAGGIIAIDSGMVRREMATCYLLETADQLALIEVGSNYSADRILQVIAQRGWRPDQVSHVIVTHVHLDHAGGAGKLIQALPSATLLVHPRGERHMVDPTRLEAGTRAVYGDEEFDAMYGSLVPVPQHRVQTVNDGESIAVGDRELFFVDTPGHARHHFCVWDELTRGWFTGDTFGISYRDLDTANGPFVFPTTTPIQFDPEALVTSIGMLMEKHPEFMYLTHFGRVGDTRRLAADMVSCVAKLVEIAEEYAHSENRTDEIEREMLAWLCTESRAHGVILTDLELNEVLLGDVKLNTMGIEYWLDHRKPA